MSPEPILDWLTIIGLAGVTGAVASAVMNWVFEGRKFKREQRLADLKEKLDRYYSPLNFHFENMRSWAVFLKSDDRYAWGAETLAGKLKDMNDTMRSGLRFASQKVQDLWYEWQPFAVAAVEESRHGRQVYAQFDPKGFLDRTERLHEAIKTEKEELLDRYHEEIGVGGVEVPGGDGAKRESTEETERNDLEKKISDVIRVEGGIVAFSMVALGFLLSAISSFNQTNIGLFQIGMIKKLCSYVPIAPTFQYFIPIVLADVASLSTGLFSRIIPSGYSKWKLGLIVMSVLCLLVSLGIFAYVIWTLRFAFYYPPC